MTAHAHPERIPDLAWAHRPEPFLVPTPAAQCQPLTGRSLILTDPGNRCWRHDITAVSEPFPDDQHGYAVATLDVHTLARTNRIKGKTPAVCLALHHLWVEDLYPDWASIPDQLRPPPLEIPPLQPHLNADTLRVDPTRPPIRHARQGNKMGGAATIGARVILNTPHRLIRGFRVISQPHLVLHNGPNIFGDLDMVDAPLYLQCYTICDEPDYYHWADTGDTPPSRRFVQCGEIFFE